MPRAANTILFLCADPSDETRLRLGQEVRDIEHHLQRAKLRSRFELVPKTSVRLTDLSQYLLDYEPTFVHFSGHGTLKGELCFEGADGKSKTAPKEAIAALFSLSSRCIKGVILNSCFSEPQAKAILKAIPSVIGMRKEIGDSAAIAFATGFYKALGAGKSVGEAFDYGKVELRLLSIPEHEVPVLFQQNPEFPAFVLRAYDSPPPSFESRYIRVVLPKQQANCAYFNFGAHSTLQSFLDDVYLKCLHKHFRPYTYGKSWWLCDSSSFNRSRPLVPLSWFKKHRLETVSELGGWGSESLSSYGLKGGAELMVETPRTMHDAYWVFATKSKRLAFALQAKPKFMYFVRAAKSVSFEKLNSHEFPHIVICRDWCGWSRGHPLKGVAIVEENKVTSDALDRFER